MHKKKIISLGLSIIFTLGVLTGCTRDSKEEPATTVKEAKVSLGTITEDISLSGSLIANKSTSVTSTSKSIVSDIYVQSGEEVLEGEDIILLKNGTVVEAPYTGTISKISTSINEDVDVNTVLFTIIDDSSYKIEASVDESEISKVVHGQEVDITVTATNKELEGTVTNVDMQATSNGNSSTFSLVITVDGDDIEGVYPGMSTEMSIIIKESKDVLTVPIQAVSSNKGVKTVTVKDGDTTKEVTVITGAQDSSFVEIISGLNEGDVVIYEQATKSQSSPMMSGDKMMGGQMSQGISGERPPMPQGGTPPQMPN